MNIFEVKNAGKNARAWSVEAGTEKRIIDRAYDM
jgi:hypothetical protein